IEITNAEREIQKNKKTLNRLNSNNDKSKKIKNELEIAKKEILKLNNSRLVQRIAKLTAKESASMDQRRNLLNRISFLICENKSLKKEFAEKENKNLYTYSIFPNGSEFNNWALSLSDEDLIENLDWGKLIVSCGSGPFSCDAFNQILKNHSFEISNPGSSESFVMVVGHECKMKDLNKQINARGEMGLKIYSQELALFALATKIDPFNANLTALLQEGNAHPIISKLINNLFNWPNIRENYHSHGSELIDASDWNDASPLTSMGYIVGNYSSLSKNQRRAKLKQIYSSNLVFPESFSFSQKNEWGKPESNKRLSKMAEHIAWNIARFASRTGYENAVNNWEEDLYWMKESFYTKKEIVNWPNLDARNESPPKRWLQ
ncbi:MAG: hypothetical protein NTZ94_01005, partial [Verrucomicrobia bacterium]|nr:hypothetical protein [Verrucomicrobiota bacterium]